MAEINILDILGGDDDEVPSKRIRTQKHSVYTHKIFIDGEIGDPKEYRDEIDLLLSVGENDSVQIFINSGGGNLVTALAIIEAIKSCEATVSAILMGECHSAATLIALNCDNIVVLDSSHMMIHTAQFGQGGTITNVKGHSDFTNRFIRKILDLNYVGFLTQTEMDDLYKGIDLWLDSDEIVSRLEVWSKHREEKLAQEEAKIVAQTKQSSRARSRQQTPTD